MEHLLVLAPNLEPHKFLPSQSPRKAPPWALSPPPGPPPHPQLHLPGCWQEPVSCWGWEGGCLTETLWGHTAVPSGYLQSGGLGGCLLALPCSPCPTSPPQSHSLFLPSTLSPSLLCQKILSYLSSVFRARQSLVSEIFPQSFSPHRERVMADGVPNPLLKGEACLPQAPPCLDWSFQRHE